MRSRLFLILSLLVAAAIPVLADRPEQIPNPKTRDNTWVTDVPSILRQETVQQLNRTINQLERDTTAEIAVVVIKSLDGRPVEEFAVDLFRRWGIGKRQANNGVLFLWATKERRVKVEVGYGLEGVLPDGKVGAILDQDVIPRFRAKEYDEGVLQGVRTLASVIRSGPPPVTVPAVTVQKYEPEGTPLWVYALLGGIVPVGIGLPIGLRLWRRYRPRKCPDCGAKMNRLSEVEEDELLEEAKQTEEGLGSVDYDVWKCPECYKKCPQCGHRTVMKTETTIREATIGLEGLIEEAETCALCMYRTTWKRTIPMVAEPRIMTGNTSSGSSYDSSSFSGGGFGSGDYSG